MIDNFELIKPMLTFDSVDDFYFANILQRKKEHPHLGNNSYVVKSYFIKSLEELERHKFEMVGIAALMNARVYINLNRRSFEKIAFHTLSKIADTLSNREYKNIKKAYTSVCGAFSNETNKKWLVDIDTKDMDLVTECIDYIETLQPLSEESKIYDLIPTKHGYHLITKPFNKQDFKNKFPEIDIQGNNPTILYVP